MKKQQITENVLVAKKCEKCTNPMHIHKKGQQIIFSGCDPCIIDLKVNRSSADEVTITGRRSTKCVRCIECKVRHLVKSFEEVTDAK